MSQYTEAEIKLQQKFALKKKKKREEAEKAAAAKAKAQDKQPTTQAVDALDKAKAILAKTKTPAVSQAAVSTPPTSSAQKVDPLLAAKRALQETKKDAAAIKRPGLKRPTVQRTVSKAPIKQDEADASPQSTQTVHAVSAAQRPLKRPSVNEAGGRDTPATSSAPAWEPDRHPQKRPRREEASTASPPETDSESTVFVGDLPPYYKNEDLYSVFAHWGEIDEVRVMGTQCYAFVRFKQAEVAQRIVQHFAQKPLTASGHELRINLAHGQLPAWKRTPGYDTGRVPRGQPHPRVLQAQHHGDALAQQLLAAGSHGLDFNARPCEREIVTYDDL